ncbi:PEP-CTERM sorting domain-containing protein [Pseudorhodoferax sp. LjRoot39]|uniref:PEP-CTERM sorting domain-containing protein n=1 Tax=Pseudorhodoferax sp. LjRoot39 TaxID=3342328 RepID=UPI003ED0A0D7
MKKLIAAASVMASVLWSPAQAAPTTLTWVDSGAYTAAGFANPASTNYLAGNCVDPWCQTIQGDFRNFFVFDTAPLVGTVTSGILRLRNGFVPVGGVYSIFDVTTPITALREGGTGLTGVYDDLGSGVLYGSTPVESSDVTGRAFVDVVLNAAAIAAINASNGLFALGGNFDSTMFAFGGTNTDERRQLILEINDVPEPSSVALCALGVGLVAAARRRKLPTAAR